jgi:putative proteasome-type protease
MTYCVAIKLNAGLVFLSDSRTNAGLDQISSFRKMMVYEKPATASWCCCRRAT